MRAGAPAVALAIAAAGALALSACGAGSSGGDLFSVDRTGAIPGAKLRLVIEDIGLAHCNGSAGLRMPDELLLDARQLQRDLAEPAKRSLDLPGGPQSVLRYDVHSIDGRVRFADDSHGPPVLGRVQLFVRETAQQVCKLPR